MERAKHKPRGRPREYDPQDALERATGAFWRSGYSGTSLDEIAAATGMNRPSLKAAFGDKHALYIAALRAYWDHKLPRLRAALGKATLEDALLSAYETAITLYFSPEEGARGCFVVGTAITEAVEDPEIRRIVADGFRTIDADFEARMRLAIEAGELDKDADPEALAIFATAIMQTIALRARSGSPPEVLRGLAAKAVAIIYRKKDIENGRGERPS